MESINPSALRCFSTTLSPLRFRFELHSATGIGTDRIGVLAKNLLPLPIWSARILSNSMDISINHGYSTDEIPRNPTAAHPETLSVL